MIKIFSYLKPNFSRSWGNLFFAPFVAFLIGYLPVSAFADQPQRYCTDYGDCAATPIPACEKSAKKLWGQDHPQSCGGSTSYFVPITITALSLDDPNTSYRCNAAGFYYYPYCSEGKVYKWGRSGGNFHVHPDLDFVCPDVGTPFSGLPKTSDAVGSGFTDDNGCEVFPRYKWLTPSQCDDGTGQACAIIDGYIYGEQQDMPPQPCYDENGKQIGSVGGGASCPTTGGGDTGGGDTGGGDTGGGDTGGGDTGGGDTGGGDTGGGDTGGGDTGGGDTGGGDTGGGDTGGGDTGGGDTGGGDTGGGDTGGGDTGGGDTGGGDTGGGDTGGGDTGGGDTGGGDTGGGDTGGGDTGGGDTGGGDTGGGDTGGGSPAGPIDGDGDGSGDGECDPETEDCGEGGGFCSDEDMKDTAACQIIKEYEPGEPGAFDIEALDSDIEAQWVELSKNISDVQADAKKFLDISVSTGGGVLPCFTVFENIRGITNRVCLSDYSSELSSIATAILLLAAFLALMIIFR